MIMGAAVVVNAIVRRVTPQRVPLVIVLLLACAGPGSAQAATASHYRPAVVIVGFRAGVSPTERSRIVRSVEVRRPAELGRVARSTRAARRLARRVGTVFLLRVRRGGVMRAIRALKRHHAVRFAEPDYLMRESATPNDPSFNLQWGSLNIGQTVNGYTGSPHADDSATAAWNLTTGSRSVVIGETDSGVQYTHPDLAANIWSNPGGIGGCPAGTHGYNFVAGTCDPMDDETHYGGHGTHVAGILGALGNNGTGVAGMNWSSTILPVKWLDSTGSGDTSSLISSLDWLVQAKRAGVNVRIVNDSATFVGTAYSQALSDEIDLLGSNDILFVTAAGNTGDNNDNLAVRRYPCGYDRPTEICVTASDQNDKLPSWANYGANTVDLAAPGANIYSTLRNGTYGYISGGSMASPQVAGAAALVLARGYMSAAGLKADILSNVDVLPSLSGLVRTGGRLNVCKAVPGCSAASPPTFGKTQVGGSSDTFAADRKRVSKYALPVSGAVSKLSLYLAPGGVSGQQSIKGVIYADSGGAPGKLIATTNELVYQSTQSAGWYDLAFASPVNLAAGSYWIGVITGGTSDVAAFRYDWVSGSRDINSNPYVAGPSDPFGSPSADGEQMSLYATYQTAPAPPPPPPPPPPPTTATFGKTSVGGSADTFLANRKRVNAYSLPRAGAVSKLSIYLAPTSTAGQQLIEGVIYASSGGSPAGLIGTSQALTFSSTQSAGWYNLTFASPVNLAAGTYWLGVITGATSGVAGFRYDSVAGARDYNTNTYTSGPTNPFGSFSSDSVQTSLYATYTPS
jgi:subtilisin family serine protease